MSNRVAISIITVLLCWAFIAVLPWWPYSRRWGHLPASVLFVLVVIMVTWLTFPVV